MHTNGIIWQQGIAISVQGGKVADILQEKTKQM